MQLSFAQSDRPPAPVRGEAAFFDFTAHMERLVEDIVHTVPELAHIRTERLLICASQARHATRHGVHARVVPLRFGQGALTHSDGKRVYAIPRIQYDGREVLYLIYFYLPRFLDNTSLEAKLATVCHELYHISPQCDGDLRRFPGRAYAHGHSRRQYHAQVKMLAAAYLERRNGDGLGPAWFLEKDFWALQREQGPVLFRHVPLPKVRVIHQVD